VATTRQVQANRANARISTGPKSRAGRSRSARNARRHGLSIPILSDPTLSAAVEALAVKLAGPSAARELHDRALTAAMAHLDVDRVRRARHLLIVQEFESDYVGPTTGQASIRYVKDLIQLHGLLSQGVDIPWRLQSLLLTPEGAEKFALVITNLARQLAVLERYERRALARRKKAFRRFATERRKYLQTRKSRSPLNSSRQVSAEASGPLS
jgi:hypothetical protein